MAISSMSHSIQENPLSLQVDHFSIFGGGKTRDGLEKGKKKQSVCRLTNSFYWKYNFGIVFLNVFTHNKHMTKIIIWQLLTMNIFASPTDISFVYYI